MKSRKTRNHPVINCAYCHTEAARRTTRHHTFGKGKEMILIQNVETVVCDNCGVDYLEGPALRAVDTILQNPDQYTARLTVAAVDFKTEMAVCQH